MIQDILFTFLSHRIVSHVKKTKENKLLIQINYQEGKKIDIQEFNVY